jgi:bacteriocin biosynthesis cyclodehydratase domain-containing protein
MGAPSHLRLKRHLSVVAHSADEVELRYGTWNPISYTLSDGGGSGRLLVVLQHLDGRPASEVAAAAGVSRGEVDALLSQLADLDVLENGASHALDHYLDNAVPNLLPFPGAAGTGTQAVVLGDGDVPERVRALLTAATASPVELLEPADERRETLRDVGSWLNDGLAFEEATARFADWRDRLVVWASSTVRPHELRALNRVALRHGFSWLHASIDGPFLLVGPLFGPRGTPCFECLERRILMNLREAASYQRYVTALAEGRSAGGAPPHEPLLCAMLASHASFEALNFMLTGTAFTVGRMLAIYLPTFEFTFNEVLALPGCPACAPSPERDDRELYFDVRALLGHEH